MSLLHRVLLLSVALLLCLNPGLFAADGPSQERSNHSPLPRAMEDYEEMARGLLAGAEVDVMQLRRAWLATPDFVARSNRLAAAPKSLNPRALEARLELYAADLHALHAGAETAADPLIAEGIVRRVLQAVLTSGDGSRDAPWVVSSRWDAVSVLTIQDQEVVGGYYHVSTERRLTLRLFARTHPGAHSREWAFDLSDVYLSHRDRAALQRPAARFSPLIHLQNLARLGDAEAMASAAMVHGELGLQGAEQVKAKGLFESVRAGNCVADAMLADAYWQLADRRTGPARTLALQEAARGHHRAMACGYAYARFRLGMFEIQQGDRVRGIQLLEQGATLDDIDSLRALARIHGQDRHADGDADTARLLYRRLHELGDTFGRRDYAHWALLPADAPRDPVALEALLANVKAQDAPSISLQGDLHAFGRYFPRDHERALELWRQAAASTRDLDDAHAIAMAMVHNPPSLQDPEFAAELMTQWLTGDHGEVDCAACHVTWAEALLASGRSPAAAVAHGLSLLEDVSEHPDRDRLLKLRDALSGVPPQDLEQVQELSASADVPAREMMSDQQ